MADQFSRNFLFFCSTLILATFLVTVNAGPFPVRGAPVDANAIFSGASCRERNLCCSGRDSSCAIPLHRPDGSVSILGNLIGAADNSAKECYCDSACITLGDCCADYKDTCGVVDCQVSEWDQWSECNVSCGVGIMSRTRTVALPARNGGKECPDLLQKRACSGQKCEIKDDVNLLREMAIILQSSFSSTRKVNEGEDIRRNLRLNYPKDPLMANVIEYTVLFEVTKSKKACENLGAEVYSKLQEGSKVCVKCQSVSMRRHLGYRCNGHGSVGKTSRWTTLGNAHCNGKWIRQDDRQAASYCSGNATTLLNNSEPDFIFV